MNQLLALTVAQPWPWAICELGKRLENRSWTDPRLVPGQWLAIHGGKVPPEGESQRRLEFEDSVLTIVENHSIFGVIPITFLEYEGIVAVCQVGRIFKPYEELEGLSALKQRGWRARNESGEEDQFAWMLENLSVLKSPVKVPGKQGLWPVTGDVLEQVRAEVRILQAERKAA
jgi:hypothetical protein